jgi:hypothetical protein
MLSFGPEAIGVEISRLHSLRSMSANAFHEKAGRSQVGSFIFLCWTELFTESPLSPPFHPHSRGAIFARCKLGVLVSAGAATC